MSLAVVLAAPGRAEVVAQEPADLGAADARLRVEACGVCGSDLTSYRTGAYVAPGQVMGHEFVGQVVEAGAEADVAVGDRLVVRPMRACGTCWYCRRGDIHLCSGTAKLSLSFGLPGGYAEVVHLPAPELGVDVFALPDDVPASDAIWTEPLAVATHAVAVAGPLLGSSVLVLGAGSVGLCLIVAARLAGATVRVVEPRATRRQIALSLGAEEAVGGLADLTGSGVATIDVVLDSTGLPIALEPVLAQLPAGAHAVLVGVTAADLSIPAGREVRGSFGYDETDFARAAALIVSGRARLGAAVTHAFDLHSFDTAMTVAASDPDVGKVVITP